MIKLLECLVNPDTKEERYTFLLPNGTHAVVKFFDPVQKEVLTVKWFLGSYDAVRSHWRTLKTIDPSDVQVSTLLRCLQAVDQAHDALKIGGS